MKAHRIIGLLTFGIVSLGILSMGGPARATDSAAESSRLEGPPACGETFADMDGFAVLTSRAGKFSPSTGETLIGPTNVVSAYVESFDGKQPVGFGTNPVSMFLFTTSSGRVVVRFLDWAGPY